MKIRIILFGLLTLSFFLSAEESYSRSDILAGALANSMELKLKENSYDKAGLELKKVKASRGPTIGTESSLVYLTNPMEAIVLTAGEMGSQNILGEEVLMPSEDTVLFSGMEPTNYEFKVTLDQPIFAWGKINNGVKAGKAGEKAANLLVEKERATIETTVDIYLTSAYYLKKISNSLNEQKKISHEMVFLSKSSWENGFLLESDYLDARVKAQEVNLAEAMLQEQITRLEIEVSRLSGFHGLTLNTIDWGDLLTEAPESLVFFEDDMLVEYALTQGFDMKLLSVQKQSYEYLKKIRDGSRYGMPDFGFHAEATYSGSRFPFVETGWYTQDSENFIFAVGIKSTLYDGGVLAAERKLAEKDLEKADIDIENAQDQIETFIKTSLNQMRYFQENSEFLALKVENEKLQREQKYKEWQSGYGNEVDVFSKDIDILTLEIELYRNSIEFYNLFYQVKSAVNGEILY